MGDERQASLNEALIIEYYPTAQAIARRVARRLPPGVDVDDLTSVAALGLIEAVQRFDPSRGVPFHLYAKHRILGAVMDSLRAVDWVPHGVRRKGHELDYHRERLDRSLGRAPTVAEVAEVLGLTVGETRAVMDRAQARDLVSLDALPTEVGETVHDGQDLAHQLERRDLRRLALDLVEKLPAREREAVLQVYLHDRSLKDVGVMLGVSESRVCQLCRGALEQIRTQVEKQGEEP